MTALAPHLSAFLEQHLPRDRRASLHTIDSYALSFELLLEFAGHTIPKRVCLLEIEQLTPQLILDFSTAWRSNEETLFVRAMSGWQQSRPFSAIWSTEFQCA